MDVNNFSVRMLSLTHKLIQYLVTKQRLYRNIKNEYIHTQIGYKNVLLSCSSAEVICVSQRETLTLRHHTVSSTELESSMKQPMLSHQLTNALQCLSPSLKVSASPITISPFFARVSATFIRRQSFKKPMRPCLLDLTEEKMIKSRSLPW